MKSLNNSFLLPNFICFLFESIIYPFQVLEYRVDKVKASENALMKPGSFFKNHAIKTKYGFDRVVEDLIQEAMSKGDFDKLSGTGKPLSHAQTQNPYVDFTEHKINKILLDNGFTPEWITLQKEIRISVGDLEEALRNERAYFGAIPLTETELSEWSKMLEKHEHKVDIINKTIDKYNIIVPILNNQMLRIDIQRIGQKILKLDPGSLERKITKKAKEAIVHEKSGSSQGFISFLSSWL